MAQKAIPPPYRITPEDKRGLLVVTGACVLAFVWCCFMIRLWIRLQTRQWRSDDWLLTIASVSPILASRVLLKIVKLGSVLIIKGSRDCSVSPGFPLGGSRFRYEC